MAQIVLQFPRNPYPSLQVGDQAYYTVPTNTADSPPYTINNPEYNEAPFEQGLVLMGTIIVIDHTTSLADGTPTTSITFDLIPDVPPPNEDNFIFFEKNKNVNITSPLGYYATAKFFNTSTSKAEIFSASCEISESSK